MKTKDLNGIWRERLDMRGREYIRPLRESQCFPTDPVTPDEEKGPCKKHGDPDCKKCGKKWVECPKCGSPDDGKFRLICLNFGEKACRVCRTELKESCEAFAYVAGGRKLEDAATLWLRKVGKERVNRKGYMAVRDGAPRKPWEEK